MKRILLSVMTVALVAGAAFAASGAFFSDTETSVDNTFAAGELDLKVDSECHYWTDEDANGQFTDVGCGNFGTWTETDLGEIHKFFNFLDVKPGDFGEDTISLHVLDNDAWGWFSVLPTEDLDNDCTEPELEEDVDCGNPDDGELQENILFNVWLDQGQIPGFQGEGNDTGEGDNIFDEVFDIPLGSPGPIDPAGENYNLWEILALVRAGLGGTCSGDDSDGDGHTTDPTTGVCQGLAVDGRLVASTTYYFGVEWELPTDVGNEAQTDSFVADMEFVVEQHRNNPSPSPLPTP